MRRVMRRAEHYGLVGRAGPRRPGSSCGETYRTGERAREGRRPAGSTTIPGVSEPLPTPPRGAGPGEAILSLGATDLRSAAPDEALGELVGRLGSALGDVAAGLDRVSATGALSPLARTVDAPREAPAEACAAAQASPDRAVGAGGWVGTAARGPGGRPEAVLWARDVGDGSDAQEILRLAATRVEWLLENVRLREDLERAMAQVLQDDERMLGRMGLDIHDGPTQQLSVALLEVQLLDAELAELEPGSVPESVRPALGRMYETLGGALHEMRELIGNLRPAQFQDRALDDILGDAITAFEARTDVPVERDMRGDFAVNGVSVSQRITFYRILQEALANAHRHGHAASVAVDVVSDSEGTTLTVRDNGRGFDPDTILADRGAAQSTRHGLRGMGDRARLLGGTCDIESAPGQGARISVFLPRWQPSIGLGGVADGQ